MQFVVKVAKQKLMGVFEQADVGCICFVFYGFLVEYKDGTIAENEIISFGRE